MNARHSAVAGMQSKKNGLSPKAQTLHLLQNGVSEETTMRLFKALPSNTPDDVLLNDAIPSFQEMVGDESLAEHLGEAVRCGFNGSINAHISLNGHLMGGTFAMNEDQARNLIQGWLDSQNLPSYGSDAEIGFAFLTEVIAKIVD